MANTEVFQFHLKGAVNNDGLDSAVKALKGNRAPAHFVIGTHLQDQHLVQVTVESNDTESGSHNSFIINGLQSCLGNPTDTFNIAFNTGSVFQTDGPATSPVVEYVQSFFPVSRLTHDFRQQIEADFNKFNSILNSDGLHAGRGELAYGWTGEVSHPDIQDEKAVAFTVTCGWDTMDNFEKSLKTEAFGKAIPTLYAWGAPYKMWHVESQVRSGAENGV